VYSTYGSFLEQPGADPVELSERLDVGYMIKGSVRRDPDRVRLIVHLIEARSGQHLWSETYDRPLTPENLFGVQEQLAADLAGQLAQPYGIIHEVSAASLSRITWITLPAGTARSIAFRKRSNSWCRWRCMQWPITVPSSTLSAANRVVMP